MSERRAPLTKKQRRCVARHRKCRDCGVDIFEIGHYCMLPNELWAATGLGPFDGMLCLLDIERRIGRRPTPEDFTAVFPSGWQEFVASRIDNLFWIDSPYTPAAALPERGTVSGGVAPRLERVAFTTSGLAEFCGAREPTA